MEVIYRHKSSRHAISLDLITENKDTIVSIVDATKPYLQEWRYIAKDIPVSEDFEIIVNNTEFTLEELNELLFFIPFEPRFKELSNKLQNMIRAKHKLGEK